MKPRTGPKPGEIDLTLADANEARSEAASPEDRVPEFDLAKVVSRRGDLWILGPHRLLCGDGRGGAAYAISSLAIWAGRTSACRPL